MVRAAGTSPAEARRGRLLPVRPKKLAKILGVSLTAGALLYVVPVVALPIGAWLIFGLVDVSRHRRRDAALLNNYFFGRGALTWLLSPVNLFFDAISYRRPYRLELDDFPEEERAEIREVLDHFDTHRDELITGLRARMEGRDRGMLFYKWYGRNVDTSEPALNRDFTYVKTIGVSIFNRRVRTSLHFGPLRLTIRLLYNLTPRRSEDIFIEVNGERHYWHDDPLFIFDDTIEHQSVNGEDLERFCVFVDLLRPGRFTRFQNFCVGVLAGLLSRVNRIFYKNWDMLAGPAEGGARTN